MSNKNGNNAGSPTPSALVKYFYFRQGRTSSFRPGNEVYYVSDRVVTIATSWNKNRTKLHYQVAVCMPTRRYMSDNAVYQRGDDFSRKLGRTIAHGRLNSNPQKVDLREVSMPVSKLNASQLEKLVLEHAVQNKNLPDSARKVLRLELKRKLRELSNLTERLVAASSTLSRNTPVWSGDVT